MLGAPFAIIFLLTGVTSARLGYPSAARNLGRELGFRGVHQIRLLRAGALRKPVRRPVCGATPPSPPDPTPSSTQEHLLRVAECDLALDTLSYNSHTTGSDALWAGVPLVTLSGGNFPSRVAQVCEPARVAPRDIPPTDMIWLVWPVAHGQHWAARNRRV